MASETFGQRLRRLRTYRNISQDQFAEALRATRQTVSNWENDKSAVDYFSLKDIQKLLGVSWEELMQDDYEEKPKSSIIYDNTAFSDEEYNEEMCRFGLNPWTNIAKLSKAGDYRITCDDLRVVYHYLRDPISCIAVAKEAKELGFTVLGIEWNNFRIRFETDEKAKDFKKMLDDIFSKRYEHAPRFNLTFHKYLDKYTDVMYAIANEGSRDVFDIKTDVMQVLTSPSDGVMGCTESVEEAKELAKKLGLKQYVIFEEKK